MWDVQSLETYPIRPAAGSAAKDGTCCKTFCKTTSSFYIHFTFMHHFLLVYHIKSQSTTWEFCGRNVTVHITGWRAWIRLQSAAQKGNTELQVYPPGCLTQTWLWHKLWISLLLPHRCDSSSGQRSFSPPAAEVLNIFTLFPLAFVFSCCFNILHCLYLFL